MATDDKLAAVQLPKVYHQLPDKEYPLTLWTTAATLSAEDQSIQQDQSEGQRNPALNASPTYSWLFEFGKLGRYYILKSSPRTNDSIHCMTPVFRLFGFYFRYRNCNDCRRY